MTSCASLPLREFVDCEADPRATASGRDTCAGARAAGSDALADADAGAADTTLDSHARDDDAAASSAVPPAAEPAAGASFVALFAPDAAAPNLLEMDDPSPVSFRNENIDPELLAALPPVAFDATEAVVVADTADADDDGGAASCAPGTNEIELTDASPSGPAGGGGGVVVVPADLFDGFEAGAATWRGRGAWSSADRV